MAPIHTCAPIGPDQARSGPIGTREAKNKLISRPDSSRFIPEKMYMYALCVNRMLYVYMYAPCVCCPPLFHVSVTLY